MEGKRFIHSIQLQGLLSFAPNSTPIVLQPLNVLIGANGVGKSNLIAAVALLHALPTEHGLADTIAAGGGIAAWLWQGAGGIHATQSGTATLQATVAYQPTPIQHTLFFADRDGNNAVPWLLDEHINGKRADDPERYPERAYLAQHYPRIAIYRDLGFGRGVAARQPQPTTLPTDHLQVDGGNLAVVLNSLSNVPALRRKLRRYLRRFNPSYDDYSIDFLDDGRIQFYLLEKGLQSRVPAARVSDGTVRYLCLLAVLLHPSPPPLVCIEEPELGLHPDIMGDLADLLVDAAQRTQLIVTTHSRQLVGRLSEHPEAIAVCTKDEDGTHIEHLDPAELDEWLAEYSLGDLWGNGHIGANPLVYVDDAE